MPEISLTRAMRSWLNDNWMSKPDSVFNVYIKHSFYVLAADSTELKFTVDSIRGRGNARECLPSVEWQVDSLEDRVWLMHPEYEREDMDTVWWTDSTWGLHYPVIWDTLSHSWPNRKVSSWMIQFWPYGTNEGAWVFALDDWKDLRIVLYKIKGDPTYNYGWDQLCIFKARAEEATPSVMSAWVDSLDEKLLADPWPPYDTTFSDQYPLELWGEPEQKSIWLWIEKPDTLPLGYSMVFVNAFDADWPCEGEMDVNGHTVPLWGNSWLPDYDNEHATIIFKLPGNWVHQGWNSIRFRHLRTGGFRIDSVYAIFDP
jgi:hypothetical protein